MRNIEDPFAPRGAAHEEAATPPDYRPPHRLELGYDGPLSTRRKAADVQALRRSVLPGSTFVRYRAYRAHPVRERKRVASILAWLALSLLGFLILNGLRGAGGDEIRERPELQAGVRQRVLPLPPLATRPVAHAYAADDEAGQAVVGADDTAPSTRDVPDSGLPKEAQSPEVHNPVQGLGKTSLDTSSAPSAPPTPPTPWTPECSGAVRALGLCADERRQAAGAQAAFARAGGQAP
jgi:hypothetical protein